MTIWIQIENDGLYGKLEDHIDQEMKMTHYWVCITTDSRTLETVVFGNKEKAEQYLRKVITNPTFYKLKYSSRI